MMEQFKINAPPVTDTDSQLIGASTCTTCSAPGDLMDARARAQARLMAFDVDGVMTDGGIITPTQAPNPRLNAPRRRWAQDAGKGRHHRGDHHRRQAACVEQGARNPSVSNACTRGFTTRSPACRPCAADLGLDATAAGWREMT